MEINSIWFLPLLFATGLVSGLVDSIAGGGGLIAVPVLLGIGLPPQTALGTNKLQGMFGTATATMRYVRGGIVNPKDCLPGIIFTFIGAGIGTWSVEQIDPGLLRVVIPYLLLVILIYSLVSPRLGEDDRDHLMSRQFFYFAFGLALGFYDGFFGPGGGSFWTFAFVIMLGFNLRRATGYTKVMNLTSNLISLALFLFGGHVLIEAGLIMGVGQISGAMLGSGLVIKKGARFIRPFYLTVVVLLTLKLFYDLYGR